MSRVGKERIAWVLMALSIIALGMFLGAIWGPASLTAQFVITGILLITASFVGGVVLAMSKI